MKSPFFSIFIPAKDRPKYLVDAIESVLLQDCQDFEIVISNNGADPKVREVAARYFANDKVRYIEQLELLNMPDHWDKVTNELSGEYVLILTDRSVLRAEALSFLLKEIETADELPEVITWPWDIYYDNLKVLLKYPATQKKMKSLNSNYLLSNFAPGSAETFYFLPRGLNSCVRNEFLRKIRMEYGRVFRTLNPDFSFGYLCLMRESYINHIDYPLFISQGLKVSNGGNGFDGDAFPYIHSLNLSDPFKNVPLKLPLVYNSIHQDYLEISNLCKRQDLLKAWSRENYYSDCFSEIDAKRKAGILSTARINEMEEELINTLSQEDLEIQRAVYSSRTLAKRINVQIVRMIIRILGSGLQAIKTFVLLRKKEGVTYGTALEAAGFQKAGLQKKDT